MTRPPTPPESVPGAPMPPEPPREKAHVVPLGTLMLIAALLLSIIWLWMLVLGIQQGRA